MTVDGGQSAVHIFWGSQAAGPQSYLRTTAALRMRVLIPPRKPQKVWILTPVGALPLPRTEVVKKVWEYIKKNKLQDATNKRMINADEKLREIFGKA